MTTADKVAKSLAMETPINPKTGRVWSLVDPEISARVNAIRSELQDPAKAKAFLLDAGLLTPTGKLPKLYGG